MNVFGITLRKLLQRVKRKKLGLWLDTEAKNEKVGPDGIDFRCKGEKIQFLDMGGEAGGQ